MFQLRTQDGDVFIFPTKELAIQCVQRTWPEVERGDLNEWTNVNNEVVTDVLLSGDRYASIYPVRVIETVQCLFESDK